MDGKGVVLVTGGSGYIGGWCAIALLKQGYVVRTTVRNLSREAEVRARFAKQTDPGNRLSFHAADLMADAGWDAAAEGCDYVLHVASPLGVAEPKDPDELIVPAREGAKRAVRAAIKAGAKRVVLTSSVAASSKDEGPGDWLADESCWTDPTDRRVSAYAKSKTIAERAAWELIAAEGGKTTLATVNPALVLGPVLGADYSESVQVVERLLSGRVPGVPRLGFNIVDVRDVADLHIRAMTAPEAAGQRFIAAGAYAWMGDLAALLRARLDPAAAAKVPTRKVPDLVVRLVGLFDTDLGSVAPGLGRTHDFTSAKAQNLLGWRPRPTEETVIDCAKSLIAEGLV
ncbi:MAG: dependent epimerase/dehydratase family protein [Phenylobacterium sp.]|nr:dependent epimerase/dehydratase family protein [Phenylobacterium sp.]